MKIATIKQMDIANGPGIRVNIFVSGCRHACKGCFNSNIWDFNKGLEYTEETLNQILEYMSKDYIKGITLLGGEPLEPLNQKGIYEIIKTVKDKYPDKTIWCYTGFTYEYLMNIMFPYYEYLPKILSLVDVLVDGRFELDLLDLKLKFRGSKNQRVLDLPKTMKENKIYWALPFDEGEAKYVKDNRPIIDKRIDILIKKEIEKIKKDKIKK